MLNLKRKKSVLGIDIGHKTTKIAQLRYTGGGKPVLDKCDIIETGLSDENFDGNLRTYIKENKISNALAASSLDDHSMKIRKMDLPKMPDLELLEAIKWNLRDIVDGDIDDFTINFSRIKEDDNLEEAKITLMAYAVNKEAVQDFSTRMTGIGLHPFFIEPAAVCLASTLERCHGEDDTYIAGIDVGQKNSLFFVVGNGVFTFSRPLIGINLDNYQKEKDKFNQKLAIEIQKSLDTFKVAFKMQDIKKLFLSGGGSLIPDMTDYLKTNLGVETNLLDPFKSLSNTEAFQDKPASLCAQAIGSAYLQP